MKAANRIVVDENFIEAIDHPPNGAKLKLFDKFFDVPVSVVLTAEEWNRFKAAADVAAYGPKG